MDPAATDAAGASARLQPGAEIIETTAAAGVSAGSYRFEASLVQDGRTRQLSGSARVGATLADSGASVLVEGQDGDAQLIVVDSTGYLYGPATNGRYQRLDPTEPGLGRELLAPVLRTPDLDQAVGTTLDALEDVRELGTETVDGVETRHYRVVVDSAEVEPVLTFGLEPGQAPQRASYDLWVDADDLTRKMSYAVSGSSAVVRYFDYGTPVTVDRPPASMVTG